MKAIIEIASVVLSCPHCKERIKQTLQEPAVLKGIVTTRIWLWEDFDEYPRSIHCVNCGEGFEIPGQFEAFTR